MVMSNKEQLQCGELCCVELCGPEMGAAPSYRA